MRAASLHRVPARFLHCGEQQSKAHQRLCMEHGTSGINSALTEAAFAGRPTHNPSTPHTLPFLAEAYLCKAVASTRHGPEWLRREVVEQ